MLLSKIEQYWTKRAEGYSEANRHGFAAGQDQVWFREIRKHLPEEKNLKILDVGTGPGFFAIDVAISHNLTWNLEEPGKSEGSSDGGSLYVYGY